MTDPATDPARRSAEGQADPRSLARLFAVQALYQIAISQKSAAEVVAEFRVHRFGTEIDGVVGDPDEALFEHLVIAASAHGDALDGVVTAGHSGARPTAQLELLIRTILRCGACELTEFTDLPVGVVINEYIDIAHAFYSGGEPGLINGVLDNVAKQIRRGADTSAPTERDKDGEAEPSATREISG